MEEHFSTDEQRLRSEVQESEEVLDPLTHELEMKISALKELLNEKNLMLEKLSREKADKEKKLEMDLAKMREERRGKVKLMSAYNDKLKELQNKMRGMRDETKGLVDKIVDSILSVEEPLSWSWRSMEAASGSHDKSVEAANKVEMPAIAMGITVFFFGIAVAAWFR